VLGFGGENAREKVIVLFTMCFALAMAMLDNTVVNVALPRIAAADGRDPRGPVRAEEALPRGPRRVHDRVGRLRPLELDDPADPRARAPGDRRRAADARDAGDHHRHVPAAGARPGDRAVGGDVGARARARSDRGRPDGRAPRMGVRLLPQRADRDRRVPSRPSNARWTCRASRSGPRRCSWSRTA
jgi:hypothetical protein